MSSSFLPNRREILFLYDVRMTNPNGDPDENRPRKLPNGQFYVTDVRLKRFARDYIAEQGQEILVDTIEGKTTNLTGRVIHYLKQVNQEQANGEELVKILLDGFIDARWFGSSLAFKAEKDKKGLKPIPKTLTGAVQFNMGEVLHEAEEIMIQGTTTFGSDEDKSQGTFTEVSVLRYGLIAFSGVANEHSARLSRMTAADYDTLLKALWYGVRHSNTRSKVGQIPRLLVSVEYQEQEEFQFGYLMDYVRTQAIDNQLAKTWSSPADYQVDIAKLLARLEQQQKRIANIRYECSPDLQLTAPIPSHWHSLQLD